MEARIRAVLEFFVITTVVDGTGILFSSHDLYLQTLLLLSTRGFTYYLCCPETSVMYTKLCRPREMTHLAG